MPIVRLSAKWAGKIQVLGLKKIYITRCLNVNPILTPNPNTPENSIILGPVVIFFSYTLNAFFLSFEGIPMVGVLLE